MSFGIELNHTCYPEGKIPSPIFDDLKDLVYAEWGCEFPDSLNTGFTKQPPILRLVAETQGKDVLGQINIVNLSKDPSEIAGITDLVVAENWRRLGIGAELIREAELVIAGLGISTILISARERDMRNHLINRGYRQLNPSEAFVLQTNSPEDEEPSRTWNRNWHVLGELPAIPYELIGDF